MKNVFFYVSLKHSILYAYYTLENLYFRLRPVLLFSEKIEPIRARLPETRPEKMNLNLKSEKPEKYARVYLLWLPGSIISNIIPSHH